MVKRLGGILRPADAIGRLGGDEFAVVLPGIGGPEAQLAAERMRSTLADLAPASIGHSCFPADGVNAAELSKHADVRLYSAKADQQRDPAGDTLELSWAAALADAVDRRMNGTHQHSREVAGYAVTIARGLGWDEHRLGLLRLAATLHDVGKVSIPDRILNKPGALSPAEYEEIKRHTVVGAEMLARIDGLEDIVPWVRHSHEHVDGSGYPAGLLGDAIPEPSRILLVADAFDAMISDRPYRRALSVDAALAELQRQAGAQFDAACVEKLVLALGAQSAPADQDHAVRA